MLGIALPSRVRGLRVAAQTRRYVPVGSCRSVPLARHILFEGLEPFQSMARSRREGRSVRRTARPGAPAQLTHIAEYERKIAELERKVGQLTMEVDFLKKSEAVGTPGQRRQFINRERPQGLFLTRGCRVMKLARSTYYYRACRPSPKRLDRGANRCAV